MPNLLLVMAGGAIGAGFRFQLGRLALHQFGPGFPWGTLIVNLLGGLLIGVLAGLLARFGEAGESLRLFLGIGILGGFTTFSAFSLETINMLNRGELGSAAAYVTVSVVGSVLLLMAGLWLVRAAS
jgi:fluoride exporter